MNALNWLAGIGLGVIVLVALSRPVGPPDDEWFREAVINRDTPVLVKFGADWCPPCRQLDGILDEVQSDLTGKVKVIRIDVEEKPNLARHYRVSAIPRLFLFDKGKMVGKSGGFADAGSMEAWIGKRLD